ncbi:alpha/beta hydrolase family esterase [Corallococcus aberystwythensis]|uniref:Phospholipase/carboxylesterase/thioesterase domain-containing protein n=1 Tax=Corallococcus aberystwythensis TaxID=2316722 RepID=A0A3A8QY15_9BACT|nr:hypothetical protein [Corallococcus aberystwythensis]RKH71790.1 hypothetical protein D7W81_06855 [Corallococcus aberystwythensis]
MRLRFLALAASSLLLTATACASKEYGDSPSDDEVEVPNPEAGDIPLPDRTACASLTVTAGTYDWNVDHQGRSRLYRVHVPTGYDPTKPMPVVFSFHGFGSNEVEQEQLSNFSALADAEGFIAVYPRGINVPELYGQGDPDTRSWNGVACCGPAQINQAVNDVSFVDRMLQDLGTRVCMDPRRIFASGFSNGAFLAYRLACERAQRIAAIAPVAGMLGLPDCNPSRPVPVLHFHGTADEAIYYDGGTNLTAVGGTPYPSAPESVRRFAERNGCTGAQQQTYQQGNSTCVAYTGCQPESATASLCTVTGGKHSWPGQTQYNDGTPDLNASLEMWRFFQAHPRP